ncbi:hypothetical protein EVAR_22423_1 [Eumeta japonica]|uniref:Uncharacterized protein n=1 Tax=Eumeta variegata TaxID=151549 RepID=A0A4C1ZTS7_EUMVA|nr:hypothetical protein EVAR_22423_1 [Eumeta japonica]
MFRKGWDLGSEIKTEKLGRKGKLTEALVMNELQLVVGSQSFNFNEKMDSQRVTRQNRRSSLVMKEACIARQEKMQARNDTYKQEKGFLYGAEIAD